MIARKNVLRGLLAMFVLSLLYFRRHITTGVALASMPLIFTYGTESFRLSEERDHFDITFDSYPKATPSPPNASLPIPPIIHNIFIGDKARYRQSWDEARQSCRDMHPGYEVEFWDEERSVDFVKREFPEVWPTWSGYRYPIQRADSLRYLLLQRYGGEFYYNLTLQLLEPRNPSQELYVCANRRQPTVHKH
jgi:inositol phosphorylceramide mannosyltransferase catalytic subunit